MASNTSEREKRADGTARLTRRFGVSALIVIAAAVAVLAIAAFALGNLLKPADAVTELSLWLALAAILILTLLALTRTWTGSALRSRAMAILAALIIASGLAPWGLDAVRQTLARMERQAEDRRHESEFLRRLETYRADIEMRIREQRPYAPADALALVDFVQGSDLSWRSLPDHWNEALPMLTGALDGAILDPNGLVKGPRPVDVRPEPLFVFFYRFNIAPLRPADVHLRDRMILSLLLDHGADLTAEAAAPLAAAIVAARTPPR